jgi:hypothetical protein
MIKKVLKIDKQGFYIEDVILQDTELTPSDCVETHCPEGFYKPKWDGEKWIEGYTQEEIKKIQEDAERNRIPSPYEIVKEENLELKLAIAEMSEEKDNEIMELKLALAELEKRGYFN